MLVSSFLLKERSRAETGIRDTGRMGHAKKKIHRQNGKTRAGSQVIFHKFLYEIKCGLWLREGIVQE